MRPAAVHLRTVQLCAAAHAGQHQRGPIPSHRLPFPKRQEENEGPSLDPVHLDVRPHLSFRLFDSFPKGAFLHAVPSAHQDAQPRTPSVFGSLRTLRPGAGVVSVSDCDRDPLRADFPSCKAAPKESVQQGSSAEADGVGARLGLDEGPCFSTADSSSSTGLVGVAVSCWTRQPAASPPDAAAGGRGRCVLCGRGHRRRHGESSGDRGLSVSSETRGRGATEEPDGGESGPAFWIYNHCVHAFLGPHGGSFVDERDLWAENRQSECISLSVHTVLEKLVHCNAVQEQ